MEIIYNILIFFLGIFISTIGFVFYIRKKKEYSKAKTIELISSIGSILAGLSALITIFFLISQFNTSIQPELVINNEKFHFLIERYKSNGYIHYYTAKDSIDKSQFFYYNNSLDWKILPGWKFNGIQLELKNIGLGVAKDIQLDWQFDKLQIKKIVEENKPDIFIDSILIDERVITIYDSLGSNGYFEFDQELNNSFNFIMPYTSSEDIVSCRVPYLYLRMYSFFELQKLFYQSKKGFGEKAKGKFPELILTINYKDISNNKYEKQYSVNIITGNYEGSFGSDKADSKLNMEAEIKLKEIE